MPKLPSLARADRGEGANHPLAPRPPRCEIAAASRVPSFWPKGQGAARPLVHTFSEVFLPSLGRTPDEAKVPKLPRCDSEHFHGALTKSNRSLSAEHACASEQPSSKHQKGAR